MARDWYLIKNTNSLLSDTCCGNTEFLEENFSDSLDSLMSTDVELYNYDLSVCKHVKAIIQNNVQDTKLKTLSRQLLVPIGTCKAGMYFKFKNRYWLIVGMVDDNKMYEKAIVTWCNYLLTWINDKGDIVQRWANISSASQYNNGETYTDHYRTRTDQLMILTPDDDESILLDQGKRFIIDQRCKIYERNFGSDVLKHTSNPVTVYKLTRADTVLFDYQDSGYHEFMVYQDEQRDEDGYYVIDGHGYWLAEEPETKAEVKNAACSIEYDSLELFNGLEAGEFIAKFTDAQGNDIDCIPIWEIRGDFSDKLSVEKVDKSILIFADNSELINKSFELFLSGDGYAPVSVTFTVSAFF